MNDFPIADYKAMLNTRHSAAMTLGLAGMEPWPADKAARLMAVVQVFGNNEGFTLSPKFNADREYIQEVYELHGGGRPNKRFVQSLKEWVSIYEHVKDKEDIDFKSAEKWIREMYNFQLYC